MLCSRDPGGPKLSLIKTPAMITEKEGLCSVLGVLGFGIGKTS